MGHIHIKRKILRIGFFLHLNELFNMNTCFKTKQLNALGFFCNHRSAASKIPAQKLALLLSVVVSGSYFHSLVGWKAARSLLILNYLLFSFPKWLGYLAAVQKSCFFSMLFGDFQPILHICSTQHGWTKRTVLKLSVFKESFLHACLNKVLNNNVHLDCFISKITEKLCKSFQYWCKHQQKLSSHLQRSKAAGFLFLLRF